MASRRGGTPILSTNAPSIEAANQSQINDLIQRNRTLEHTTKKLSAQLAEEVNRSKASVKEIQDKHEANQRQWKEFCEDVLASYRIIQKQLEVELEKERYATLAEMGVVREEKLQRIQRDYKLKLFQMHEEELERRLEEAEEEGYDLQVQQELITRRWMDHCFDYATRLKDAQEGLGRTENEKQDKEMKLAKMRESHANLDAEKETFTAKLKRAQLNLGHEQNKNKELKKELDDANRMIKDLSRQVDEWQNLEHSEDAEVENQRKKRMALEQQMQELTEKHERELERLQRSLEKERERGEKIKADTEILEEEAKNNKKEAERTNNLVKKIEKKVEKLKDELEVERARVRPASPEKGRIPSPPHDPVSDEVEIEEVPAKGMAATRKPSSKRRATVKAGLSNKFVDIEVEVPKQQVARKRTGGLPPKKPVFSKPDSDIEISDGDQEEGKEEIERRRKRKGKSKATELDEMEDDGPAVEEKRSKKRNGAPDDEDRESVEIIENPKAKRGARAASQGRHDAPVGVTRGRSKPPNSRAASRQRSTKPIAEDDAEEHVAGQPAPKKKRKINFFHLNENGSTSVLPSFGGGLDIPTQLSPLKVDEPVPQRSVSLVGSLSNMVMLPFQR